MNTFGRKPRLRARLAVPVVALLVGVLCPHQVVSKELLEEKPTDSGVIRFEVALGLTVAMNDFVEREKKAGRVRSLADLEREDSRLEVFFRKEGSELLEVYIAPSRHLLVFGGAVTYWIDLKNYRIVERRPWR